MTKDKRNHIAISLLFGLIPTLYWQLNKMGYLPPANYWLTRKNVEDQISFLPSKPELLNYERSLLDIIPAPINKSQTEILVEKSDNKLTLFYQKQAIKSYPIVLGNNPVGDKMREGDYRTPEGIFKVRDLYPHASWSKFIWLDYPNQESWSKHLEAKRTGQIKPFDTVGSEIGIHGVPPNGDYLIDEQSNWTWGCISLKNKDVDEIYQVIQAGTKVTIVP